MSRNPYSSVCDLIADIERVCGPEAVVCWDVTMQGIDLDDERSAAFQVCRPAVCSWTIGWRYMPASLPLRKDIASFHAIDLPRYVAVTVHGRSVAGWSGRRWLLRRDPFDVDEWDVGESYRRWEAEVQFLTACDAGYGVYAD